MLTQIIYSPVYRGQQFNSNGLRWACCDGQQIRRTDFDDFSNIWGSGVYGSDDTFMYMPVLQDQILRMIDMGAGRDENSADRTMLSGMFPPSGSAVGSLQLANQRTHDHVGGSQFYDGNREGGGECCCTQQNQTGSRASNTIQFTQPGSMTTGPDFTVGNAKSWAYICIGAAV